MLRTADSLRWSLVLVVGVVCLGSVNPIRHTTAAEPARRPNIVLILADDMGHGHVSRLNPQSKLQTPHIDRLASQGVTLTDAHSGSAVCSPTQVSKGFTSISYTSDRLQRWPSAAL